MMKISSYGIVPFIKEGSQYKVLLILHKEGRHWGFPKGKSDEGEGAEQAARRELKEETGLDVVEFFPFPPLTEEYHFRRNGERILKSVTYFAAIVGGQLSLQPEEIRAGKWLTVEEALKELSFKEACHILSEFKRLIDTT